MCLWGCPCQQDTSLVTRLVQDPSGLSCLQKPGQVWREGSQQGQAEWARGAIGESHWGRVWQVLTRYQTC